MSLNNQGRFILDLRNRICLVLKYSDSVFVLKPEVGMVYTGACLFVCLDNPNTIYQEYRKPLKKEQVCWKNVYKSCK